MCKICVEITMGRLTAKEAINAAKELLLVPVAGDPATEIKHLQELYSLIDGQEKQENDRTNEPAYIRRTFKE
jgi:hypothetical protein